MNQDPGALEELDLSIPDMDGEDAEVRAANILKQLPGIDAVRIVERGALITYRPAGISKEEICESLRQAGFRASTFQDSRTGQTGTSSV